MGNDTGNGVRNSIISVTFNRGSVKRLFLTFVVTSVIIVIAGLWPFNFLPENRISPLPGGKGLLFGGHGIALTDDHARELLQQLFSSRAITIELWVKPTAHPTSGVPSIVAFTDCRSKKTFFIGQWRSHLIVRTKTDQQAKDKGDYREIGYREALAPEKEHFITITSDTKSASVYIEGIVVRTYPAYNVFCDPCTVGQLVVGNAPTGKQGWSGEILGLAIYNRSLSPAEVFQSQVHWKEGKRAPLEVANTVALYFFDGGKGAAVHNHVGTGLDLTVPQTFVPPERTPLAWSWEYIHHGWSSFQDVLLNVVGFIPFGLLASAILLRSDRLSHGGILTLAVLMGISLSLAVELIQAYLPTQDSSLADLTSNTIGTALGAIGSRSPAIQCLMAKWL